MARYDGYAGTWLATIRCGRSCRSASVRGQPVGLLAVDRRDVPGVEQHEAQVVAEVEHAKGLLREEPVEQAEDTTGPPIALAL